MISTRMRLLLCRPYSNAVLGSSRTKPIIYGPGHAARSGFTRGHGAQDLKLARSAYDS